MDLMDLLFQLHEESIAIEGILKKEQLSLEERNIDEIIELSRVKLLTANKLSDLLAEFNLTLYRLGYSTNSDIHQFIQENIKDKTASEAWRKCEHQIKQCDELNRINSALVSSGIQQTIQALNFLSQNIHGESSYHYDKSGAQTGSVSCGMNIKA